MILHIVHDNKFIDMAYSIFEKVNPDNNHLVVVSKQKKMEYIKTTPITQVESSELLSKSFAKKLEKYEFVVIHALQADTMKLILDASEHIKFVWIGWGFDYYCYIDKSLFFPKTEALKHQLAKSNDFFWKKYLKRVKSFLIYKLSHNGINNIENVFNKIDYFAPVLESEYKSIQSSFENFTPKFIDWNYGNLEDDYIQDMSLAITGKNILIGNSATYENNHKEAIDMLKDLHLKGRKVICPLSYGDEKYANEIIRYGKSSIGREFEPLLNFLPISEYNKIISSCSVVIMNHIRQQAVGNIVIMMYFGAKIFLNQENPVYAFFKNNGAIVFSTDEINNNNIEKALTSEEKKINREVLKKHWSRDVMFNKTKQLIQIIKGESDA